MKVPSGMGIATRTLYKFLAAALLVSILLVGMFALSSKPAHASDGYACANQTLGTVCARVVWNTDGSLRGVDAIFNNLWGGCNRYDFNLWTTNGGNFGDEGAFWSCGGVNTYLFAVGDQLPAYVKVYQRYWPYKSSSSPIVFDGDDL